VWAASVHLSMNAPNALIQECVRAFYAGWYTELVTGLPVVENGAVRPGAGPGVELRAGLTERPDALVRRSGT
jgi:galactonate dehydratase